MKDLLSVLGFPNTNSRFFDDTTHFQKLGIAMVLLLALASWTANAVAYVSLTLLLVASLATARQREFHLVWKQPASILALAMVAYVLIWELVVQFSGATPNYVSKSEQWILLLIPWCTYWFYRFPRMIPWALFLAAVGLLLESVHGATHEWQQFIALLQGGHVFQARGWGYYLSSVTLGLLIFLPRVYGYTKSRKFCWLIRSAYLIWILWMLQCMVASQERSAWLSFAMVMLVALMLTAVKLYRRKPANRYFFIGAGLLAAGLLSGVIAANHNNITGRLFQESADVTKILTGDENLGVSSASYRYLIYQYGIDKWRDAPIFGYGPQSTKRMIAENEINGITFLSHFHSGYLELMVQMGLVGLFLFLAYIACMLWALFRSHRAGKVPGDYALFFGASFLMLLLWNTFNFRMLHPDWLFYWILLTGITQALGMYARYPLYPGNKTPT